VNFDDIYDGDEDKPDYFFSI